MNDLNDDWDHFCETDALQINVVKENTDAQTQRHTDTQTHRHTDTYTYHPLSYPQR